MTISFKKEILHNYFIAGTPNISNQHKDLKVIVEEALKAGITAFQFREKGANSLKGNDKIKMALSLRKLCKKYHVPFIIDDDVNLAERVKADGIHVGQTDENIAKVIQEVNSSMFVGLSCQTEEQIKVANTISGLSYIGSGSVSKSPSKDSSEVIGFQGLKKLTKLTNFPIVAIGGINKENIKKLPQTGVSGAAVISMIARSQNIFTTVKLMDKIKYNYEN